MGNSNQLVVQMQEILEDYSKEVKRATNNSADVVAKATVRKLKATSPKKRPKFYMGWAIKRERGTSGINTVIVYNKTHPGLTHLLTNGHVVVNAKGVVGRANGDPFMKNAEQWANEELPKEIERELE